LKENYHVGTNTEFFLAGMRAQCDKRNGRILFGDKTWGWVIMLRKSSFRVSQFGF